MLPVLLIGMHSQNSVSRIVQLLSCLQGVSIPAACCLKTYG